MFRNEKFGITIDSSKYYLETRKEILVVNTDVIRLNSFLALYGYDDPSFDKETFENETFYCNEEGWKVVSSFIDFMNDKVEMELESGEYNPEEECSQFVQITDVFDMCNYSFIEYTSLEVYSI